MSIEISNAPYSPELFHITAVYRIQIGPWFYIGSSTKIGSRRSDHLARLDRGEHHNPKLQAAWDTHKSAEIIVIQEVRPKEWDPKDTGAARAKMLEQQELDRHFGSEFCCNLSSSSIHNTLAKETVGLASKLRWQDPEWRAETVRKMRAKQLSPESRERMSVAKRGANSPHARGCEFTLNGETLRFGAASEAAAYYGVTQQVMDLWLRGVVSWPGSGPRKPKPKNAHLIGLRGRFL